MDPKPADRSSNAWMSAASTRPAECGAAGTLRCLPVAGFDGSKQPLTQWNAYAALCSVRFRSSQPLPSRALSSSRVAGSRGKDQPNEHSSVTSPPGMPWLDLISGCLPSTLLARFARTHPDGRDRTSS
jgi:hypothetical protein